MKDWIVIDLDGTLCNIERRVDLAQAKDWEAFHAGIPEDEIYEDVQRLIFMANLANFGILVITGRNERYRKATFDWMDRHNLSEHVDTLLMRPDGDMRRDGELKVALISDFFGSREKAQNEVAFILEDRDNVVEAYRGAGFPCWQVRVGGY